MADLKWLDGYSGESIEELIEMANVYRVDSLLVDWAGACAKLRASAVAYADFFLASPKAQVRLVMDLRRPNL